MTTCSETDDGHCSCWPDDLCCFCEEPPPEPQDWHSHFDTRDELEGR